MAYNIFSNFYSQFSKFKSSKFASILKPKIYNKNPLILDQAKFSNFYIKIHKFLTKFPLFHFLRKINNVNLIIQPLLIIINLLFYIQNFIILCLLCLLTFLMNVKNCRFLLI